MKVVEIGLMKFVIREWWRHCSIVCVCQASVSRSRRGLRRNVSYSRSRPVQRCARCSQSAAAGCSGRVGARPSEHFLVSVIHQALLLARLPRQRIDRRIDAGALARAAFEY